MPSLSSHKNTKKPISHILVELLKTRDKSLKIKRKQNKYYLYLHKDNFTESYRTFGSTAETKSILNRLTRKNNPLLIIHQPTEPEDVNYDAVYTIEKNKKAFSQESEAFQKELNEYIFSVPGSPRPVGSSTLLNAPVLHSGQFPHSRCSNGYSSINNTPSANPSRLTRSPPPTTKPPILLFPPNPPTSLPFTSPFPSLSPFPSPSPFSPLFPLSPISETELNKDTFSPSSSYGPTAASTETETNNVNTYPPYPYCPTATGTETEMNNVNTYPPSYPYCPTATGTETEMNNVNTYPPSYPYCPTATGTETETNNVNTYPPSYPYDPTAASSTETGMNNVNTYPPSYHYVPTAVSTETEMNNVNTYSPSYPGGPTAASSTETEMNNVNTYPPSYPDGPTPARTETEMNRFLREKLPSALGSGLYNCLASPKCICRWDKDDLVVPIEDFIGRMKDLKIITTKEDETNIRLLLQDGQQDSIISLEDLIFFVLRFGPWDSLVSNILSFVSSGAKRWYHGHLDRTTSEKLLEKRSEVWFVRSTRKTPLTTPLPTQIPVLVISCKHSDTKIAHYQIYKHAEDSYSRFRYAEAMRQSHARLVPVKTLQKAFKKMNIDHYLHINNDTFKDLKLPGEVSVPVRDLVYDVVDVVLPIINMK